MADETQNMMSHIEIKEEFLEDMKDENVTFVIILIKDSHL